MRGVGWGRAKERKRQRNGDRDHSPANRHREREVETERECILQTANSQSHPGRILAQSWLFSKLSLGKIPLAPPPDEKRKQCSLFLTVTFAACIFIILKASASGNLQSEQLGGAGGGSHCTPQDA